MTGDPLFGATSVDLSANVAKFNYAMDIPVRYEPKEPTDKEVRYRAKLIAEEFFETMRALFGDRLWLRMAEHLVYFCIGLYSVKVDMPEFADGLADLEYVCEGAFLTFGIDSVAVHREVQRSNMAKVGGPIRADGKRLKPTGWAPPDIAGVLVKQGWKP